MSDNIDFKKMWQSQETTIPDTQAIIEKVNDFKRKNTWKRILINVVVLLTTSIIFAIWYFFQPEYITTKIGIICIALAMFIYLFVYNKMSIDTGEGLEEDANHYLQQLLKLKQKQKFLQSTMLSVYFAMLSLGIGLYMYEYVSMMSMLWATVAYGVTGFWILINWVYFRPIVIKKQQLKLDALISNLESIQKQFNP